ncbi:hypothetical protein C8R47DRAFT_1076587 [Mycena vitilis]|nr:hypothetical protein C8R47DRAFT_1076587 [Mycena vitilis]
MSAFLDTLNLPGKRGFISAKYHQDYEAIRVKDLVGGSLFCFVETEEAVYPLGGEIRPRHCTRLDLFVGEVDYMSDMTPGAFDGKEVCGIICLRTRAPANATCKVLHIYAEQVKRLEEILASDAKDVANTVTASWFDLEAVSHSWSRTPGGIYARRTRLLTAAKRLLSLKPGTTVALMASPERVDIDVEEGIESPMDSTCPKEDLAMEADVCGSRYSDSDNGVTIAGLAAERGLQQ